MRTSCPELRDVTLQYAQLLNASQRLLQSHADSRIFAEALTALTPAFDRFCQQVVGVCSTVRKSVFTFSGASPLFHAGQVFTTHWTHFIEIVNQLTENGVSGYSLEIQQCFASILRVLAVVERRLLEKCYLNRAAMAVIAKSRRSCVSMMQKVEGFLTMTGARMVSAQEIQRCVQFFQSYVLEVNTMLDRTLPGDLFFPLEIAKLKIEVSVACSTLGQVVQSAYLVPRQMSELKLIIVELNALLGDLHKTLNLPFAVVLTVEEREEPRLVDEEFES
jgi:hypothetical protein